MHYSGTDSESYITEYALVHEEKRGLFPDERGRRAMRAFGSNEKTTEKIQVCLTESINKLVLQKSTHAQIHQLVLQYC